VPTPYQERLPTDRTALAHAHFGGERICSLGWMFNLQPPGQPVDLRDKEGVFRTHLFQIQGVEKVKVARGPSDRERWGIAGWGYSQGYSSFIEQDVAEFLIELGMPVGNAHSVMGNSASVRNHVLPIRKQLAGWLKTHATRWNPRPEWSPGRKRGSKVATLPVSLFYIKA
jgi:hypothetical protein